MDTPVAQSVCVSVCERVLCFESLSICGCAFVYVRVSVCMCVCD